MRKILLLLAIVVSPVYGQSVMPSGVYSVFFPGEKSQPYQIAEPTVMGQTIVVVWSDVDTGTGVYNWSSIESQISPWWAAGKKTGLVVWYLSEGTAPVATPAYVLAQLPPTVSCTDGSGATFANIPDVLSTAFQSAYTTFLKAFFAKYGSDPRIAYIRVGMGSGGETYPRCTRTQESSYGMTQSLWQNYVESMMSTEHTFTGSVPVMVGINCYGTPCPTTNPFAFPSSVAALAVSFGWGFGSQGLQESDITSFDAGKPCGTNWCALFSEYPTSFHELQFLTGSCPNNTCSTGSPSVLIPFASARGDKVLEMNNQQLGIAFGFPSEPWSSAYATAIANFDTATSSWTPSAPTSLSVSNKG